MKILATLLLAAHWVCTIGCMETSTQETAVRANGSWRFGKVIRVGVVDSPLIDESSGLAASQNFTKHFWTHNDGGSAKGLFLIDPSGTLKATVSLPEAIPFRDWEDIASARIDGVNYLFVGDFGDNLSRHETYRVYVFKEPNGRLNRDATKVADWSVANVATIEFKYDNGPRDCEAMMVDVIDKRIYFVSKRAILAGPTTLHWIPLQIGSTSAAKPLVAAALPLACNRPSLTGMSLSRDGRLAVLRSYRTAWLWQRRAKQTWAERFEQGHDHETSMPRQRQGESIAFAGDGKALLMTSEGVGQPFWKISLTQEPDSATADDEK